MADGKPQPGHASSDMSAVSVADVLSYYESRGRNTIGGGERPALIVVDFSIAFTRGTAQFASASYDAEIAQTMRLLAAARGRFPVYFTTIAYGEDARDAGFWRVKLPWIADMRDMSREVEIDERLGVQPGEPVIVKKYASSFVGTDLDERLKRDGVDTLVIAGCTTSCCVRATAVDAVQHGYRPLVAREAVGDMVPALHQLHLADLRARYADVVGVDELIGYLDRCAARG